MTHARSETLWKRGSELCSLVHRESHYELLLSREGRVMCLLAVESEDAARTFAQQWLAKMHPPNVPSAS